MSSNINEKGLNKSDKGSFTAMDTSKNSSLGLHNSSSRNDILKKLKKNRKEIKLQFMRRFPKIGVPNFNSLAQMKNNKLPPLENFHKSNRIHETSMFDTSIIETNAANMEEDTFYTTDKRIKVIWIVCLSLFVFAILFLVGSLIYLIARREFVLNEFLYAFTNIFEAFVKCFNIFLKEQHLLNAFIQKKHAK